MQLILKAPIEAKASVLAPVSEMGSAIPAKYLKGYVRLDNNQMLVVMDIERVVAKEELKD